MKILTSGIDIVIIRVVIGPNSGVDCALILSCADTGKVAVVILSFTYVNETVKPSSSPDAVKNPSVGPQTDEQDWR